MNERDIWQNIIKYGTESGYRRRLKTRHQKLYPQAVIQLSSFQNMVQANKNYIPFIIQFILTSANSAVALSTLADKATNCFWKVSQFMQTFIESRRTFFSWCQDATELDVFGVSEDVVQKESGQLRPQRIRWQVGQCLEGRLGAD